MDNITIIDKVLEKKFDNYSVNTDNYMAPQELTVTITLNEYRDLVENNATRKSAIDKAEENKFSRERRIEELEKEVAELKAELYEFQKKQSRANDADDVVNVPDEAKVK